MCLKLTDTVDQLVVAHCADYSRRKAQIERGGMSQRTVMELRYLNFRMLDAAAELVGEDDAEVYIEEIGMRRGYASTKIEDISESTYKIKKQKIKLALARGIHLID